MFFGKIGLQIKEIYIVQQAFRTEYPKDGTPSHSVIGVAHYHTITAMDSLDIKPLH